MSNLWAIDIGNVFIFMSIGVLLPIWKEDMGVTPIQAGLLGSAGFFGFGLMSLPTSIWLTKYNPKTVTFASTIGMAIAALAHSFSVNVEMLILSRFTFVALASTRLTIQIIFIQQWFESRLYSIVNGLDFSIRSIGQTLALVLIPVMVTLFDSWRLIYIIISIYMLIFSLSWIVIGKQKTTNPMQTMEQKEGNPGKILVRKKILWVIAGSQIGVACTFASFITFYPSYSMETMNISVGTAGLLMSAFPVGGIIGAVAGGALSQKIGRRKPILLFAGLLLPIMYIMLLNTNVILLSYLILLIIGVLAMSFPPILFTIPLDMNLAPREVAVAGGLNRTLFPIGATMGPIIVGALEQSSGSLLMGLTVVSPLPITLFIATIFIPETGPKAQKINA
jgi:predicted MFS family arabinose efflux permease